VSASSDESTVAVADSLAAPCGVSFAKPKSRIFAWPRLVMKMLAGLMSR
jgi:hypothetical protein